MEKYIEFLNSIKEKIKTLENDVKNNNFDSVKKLAEETINLIQNKIEFFNSENQKEEVSKKMLLNAQVELKKSLRKIYLIDIILIAILGLMLAKRWNLRS